VKTDLFHRDPILHTVSARFTNYIKKIRSRWNSQFSYMMWFIMSWAKVVAETQAQQWIISELWYHHLSNIIVKQNVIYQRCFVNTSFTLLIHHSLRIHYLNHVYFCSSYYKLQHMWKLISPGSNFLYLMRSFNEYLTIHRKHVH